MPVRMKDIARELGVSIVTVSKVLRNRADVSDETRARILNRMREMNYKPNLAARTLVTGRTSSIGLVVPDLVHPFFAVVATGISKVLRGRGYCLIMSCAEEDPELEQQEIEQLLARRVDALIIASTQWTVESFRRIEEQKTRYVLVDRRFAGLPANFVGVDDYSVGVMATEHLIAAGCRRLAHIGGPHASTALGRREGFWRTVINNGLPVSDAYMIVTDHGDKCGDVSGFAAMQKLLQLNPRPDGIFCHNDPNALGAMNAIFDAGLRIPEDIAVIGCGDVGYGKNLRVPLSSINQNSEAIGERAAELAFDLLDAKGPVQPRTIMIEPKLVIRASTRRNS